jgi:TRAP transporter 4TM/12TM fusion protein
MPPVMGATAFIMADLLARPYQDIVVAALVPSLLYYVALFIMADLEAARRGIARVEESLIPQLAGVLIKGWPFLLPFAVLVYTLFALNWLVQLSAIAASLTIVVFGVCVGYGDAHPGRRVVKFLVYAVLFGICYAAFREWLGWGFENAMLVGSAICIAAGLATGSAEGRMPLRVVYDSLYDTGTSILDLLMIAAGASFIIGILLVTGLGFALTLLLVAVGEGSLFLLLLIAAFLCIVLGMGMPTIAVYIILATLVAPSLVELGVLPIAAHMFVMYLGMMSFLTPPVAIASFFAASMADAPPMATGWASMRFGWTAYVVPFLFVFAPGLLLQHSDPIRVAIDVATATGGVWLISVAMVGYMFRPLLAPMRILTFIAGVMLIAPFAVVPGGHWTNGAGALLGLAILVLEYRATRFAATAKRAG